MSPRTAGAQGRVRAGTRFRLPALALACALAAAPPARAQTGELPVELRNIAGVRFEGLRHIGSRPFMLLGHRELKGAGLRTRPPSILPWRDRPLLRRDYLLADSVAIVAFYRHYGYLDAAVRIELRRTRDPHAAVVVFHVREGALTRVSSVELSGVHVIPERELRHALQAQPRRAYDPAFLQLDVLTLGQLYFERGHRAVVDTSSRRGVPDSAHVLVRYAVREGPEYHVRAIEWQGNPVKVRDYLGRREVLLKPGDGLRASRLELSLEHLNSTGLFRQVKPAVRWDSTAAAADLEFLATPRPPHWIDLGVGSGTSDRFRTTAEWGHRNLDTRALGGVVGGELSWYGDGRAHKRNASASLSEPWMFGVRVLGQAGLFYREEDDRAYNDTTAQNIYTQHTDSRGYTFSLYREFSRIARLTLQEENAFIHQRYTFEPGAFIADSTKSRLDSLSLGSYRTNLLRATLERDTRDVRFNPKRGSYQTLVGEFAGGALKGQTNYDKVILSSTWYAPQTNGWLLAGRVMGGVMTPFGVAPAKFTYGVDPQVARVPRESRFFIGGVNSLRGYGENAVTTDGGLTMALANAELRVPVVGPFGFEFFVDAGNVWARPQYIKSHDFRLPWQATRVSSGDLRWSYGAGARLVLPFGPLRIDFARADRPDYPYATRHGRALPFAFQFAIGPSF